uniref:Uncharacterized protein n=1 Tax=Clytia hemisphaerica TaxID=252671 RepID=A0A7M5XAC8_9CNID
DAIFHPVNEKENHNQVETIQFPILTIATLDVNHRCAICNRNVIVKGKLGVCSICGKGRLGPKFFYAKVTLMKKDDVVISLDMPHDVVQSFIKLSNADVEDMDDIEDKLLGSGSDFIMEYNSGTNTVTSISRQ